MVCLHGFPDTWRTWELVLPALERRHDVLALDAGRPRRRPADRGRAHRASRSPTPSSARWTRPGFETAHLVGNSLGGYVALQLAARGARARSWRSRRPAAGQPDDDSYRELLRFQRGLQEHGEGGRAARRAILATREGRRRATRYLTVNYEHIPPELLAHQLRGVAAATPRRR